MSALKIRENKRPAASPPAVIDAVSAYRSIAEIAAPANDGEIARIALPFGDTPPLERADLLRERRPDAARLARTRRLSAWGVRLDMARYFAIWRRRELWNYAYQFGEVGARFVRKALPKPSLQKIETLKRAETSFIILRGLPTASFRFPFPWNQRQLYETFEGRRFRQFDMVVAGLLFILGAEVKRRYQNAAAPVVRTLVSAPSEPQISDRDGPDMHLRFHQSTVEKGLPDPFKPAAGEETCIYKAFAAVRNRRRIPIYVLPVNDVIEAITDDREWTLDQLQRPIFQKIGPRYDSNDAAIITEGQSVIRRGLRDGDWLMSFDPDRVSTDDENGRRALRRLRAAINRVRNDAVAVVLNRRDVLLVDNLRALVARREYYPLTAREALRALFFQKPRWLRLYYGFPLPRR
ncbi:MAG: hypothetical protein AAFR11_13250 [Pseudomonadota bacterium]